MLAGLEKLTPAHQKWFWGMIYNHPVVEEHIYAVAKLWASRGRKSSSPSTIVRNAAICDEHARATKPLSLTQLAKKHDCDRSLIKQIWRDRQRWWQARTELQESEARQAEWRAAIAQTDEDIEKLKKNC